MNGRMYQWVIYDHPADYPDHFVVRCWWVEAAAFGPVSNELWLRPTLDSAREVIRVNCPGGYRLDRMPMDDPVIVEVWI